MFTVFKVREDLAANDYSDPGPYKNPEGTVAREIKLATEQIIPRSESASAHTRTANDRILKTTSKSRH